MADVGVGVAYRIALYTTQVKQHGEFMRWTKIHSSRDTSSLAAIVLVTCDPNVQVESYPHGTNGL